MWKFCSVGVIGVCCAVVAGSIASSDGFGVAATRLTVSEAQALQGGNPWPDHECVAGTCQDWMPDPPDVCLPGGYNPLFGGLFGWECNHDCWRGCTLTNPNIKKCVDSGAHTCNLGPGTFQCGTKEVGRCKYVRIDDGNGNYQCGWGVCDYVGASSVACGTGVPITCLP